MIDYFPYAATYQSFQLYQRGVRWKTLQNAIPNHFSHSLRELLDEWTLGFEIGSSVEDQTERELIAKLSDPNIQYLDYFTGDFDHVAHAASDLASQRLALQRIDAVIGRIWTAIESSPLAAQTVLIAVSDHGMNTEPGVYSQGYNLLHFLNSRAGGAHHVVTNRHPLDEFKLAGLDPFVSEVVTPSDDSLYLKGQADDYPTALLDPDGNERASVYFRNSDLNALHILLEEINRPGVDPAIRHSAIAAFCRIIDRHRDEWSTTIRQLSAELAALHTAIEQRHAEIQQQPKKWTREQRDAGLDKAARRLSVELDSWRGQEHDYSAYLHSLTALLDLEPTEFDRRHFTPGDLIPKRAMGDANSVYDLAKLYRRTLAFEPARFPTNQLSEATRQPLGAQQRAAWRFIASRRLHRHAPARSFNLALLRRGSSGSDRIPPQRPSVHYNPESAPGYRRRNSLRRRSAGPRVSPALV